MRFKTLFIAFWALLALMGAAYATARIHIDLSSQRMHVTSSQGSYSWPVSTARAGYYTPRGSFAPTGMQLMHYSRKYHMSPMPYSIFFRGGYPNHGTYATGALGSPSAHDHRPPAEGRIVEHLDARVERVQVGVEDGPHPRHDAPAGAS